VDKAKAVIDLVKSVFELSRDGAIVIVLVLIVMFPAALKTILINAGVQTIQYGGVTWQAQAEAAKQQTSQAVNQVAQIQASNDDLKSQLDDLAKSATSPTQKAKIATISAAVQASDGQIQAANAVLTRSLAAQDSALRQADPKAATVAGWVYLGEITEDRSAWAPNAPKIVDAHWPLAAGSSVTLTRDTNVRGDPAGVEHTAAPVVGAIRADEAVTIDQLDLKSHLRAGGWTVWARVTTP
jgi:hypothetical protein